MKLSDIKGDKTLDVIADCIGPIYSIASDEDARSVFVDLKETVNNGGDKMDHMMNVCIPKLLKDHKDDVVDIMAALSGKTAKEYAESLDLGILISDLVELITDQDFSSFLS